MVWACAALLVTSLGHAQVRAYAPRATSDVDASVGDGWALSAPPSSAARESAPSLSSEPRTDIRYLDAHSDRVLFAPTAETHPQGTLYISSYEILVPQIGYAFTDRLQLSLTGTGVAHTGDHVIDGTVKANLLRTPRLRIAAYTSIAHLRAGDIALLTGRIGGSLQWCFEPRCHSAIVLGTAVVLHDKPDILLPFVAAVGWYRRMTRVLTALLEYQTALVLNDRLPIDTFAGMAVGYGVRFSGAAWGVDLTLVRPLASVDQLGYSPARQLGALLGFPFVALTYRWLPSPSAPSGDATDAGAPPSSGLSRVSHR